MAMPEELLTIGEVINLLRDDFPDVSVSKVRFLEAQGLMAPGRTEGGYRLFDDRDLERLRFILRQQRDHFLPLKVIKSKLTMWERGEEVETEPGKTGSTLLEVEDGPNISPSEILRRSGLTEVQFQGLVDHGLIPDTPLHGEEQLAVASEARRLLALGLEPRHLRTFRHAAERQADVLSQLVSGLLRASNPDTRDQARQLLTDAAAAVLAMHKALLTQELKTILDPR